MTTHGPIASARYYLETDLGAGRYMLVDLASRRHREGDHYAYYTVVVFDNPGALEAPRVTSAHTGCLVYNCTPSDEADVPKEVKAQLENALQAK
jgi:hypothetical protein